MGFLLLLLILIGAIMFPMITLGCVMIYLGHPFVGVTILILCVIKHLKVK